MSSEKAQIHWSRFLQMLGVHPLLEPVAKAQAGAVAMGDAADQLYNDRSHRILSSDTESKVDCHHNASWTTCIDRMP